MRLELFDIEETNLINFQFILSVKNQSSNRYFPEWLSRKMFQIWFVIDSIKLQLLLNRQGPLHRHKRINRLLIGAARLPCFG
jgi:hypothetical protein